MVANVPPGGSVTLPRDWLAGELEALSRINGNGQAPAPIATPDRLLTAAEVAHRLGSSVRYVYAHAADYPFRVRVEGLVRFDPAGLERWLAQAPR